MDVFAGVCFKMFQGARDSLVFRVGIYLNISVNVDREHQAVTLPLPLHTGQTMPRLVFPVPEHLPHIPTGATAAGVCCCCIGRGGVAGTVGNVAAGVFGSASIVDDGATIHSGVRSTAAIACAVGMS